MGRGPKPASIRRRNGIRAFALAAFGAAGALLLFDLHHDRADAVAAAYASAERAARALELHTRETVSAVDADLVATIGHLRTLDAAGRSSPAEIDALLTENARSQPYLKSISLFGPDGRLVASSRGPSTGAATVADRDYFRAQAAGAAGLLVGAPVRSPFDGEWVIPLGRRVEAQGGGFAGSLVAALEPRRLQGFYEALRIGRDGVVALRSREAVLLSRAPYDERLIGRAAPDADPLRDPPPKGQAGTYRGASAEGIDRIVGYRALDDLPLVVLVGVSADEVLAEWLGRARNRVLAWLVAGLGLAGLTSVLLRQQRREDGAAEAVRESEERFRNMAEQAPIAIWVSDAAGNTTYVNRRWTEWTGQAAEDGLGFGWLERVHPDDRGRIAAAFGEALARRGAFRTEYRIRLASGDHAWAIDAAAPRFGRDGTFLGHVGTAIDISERKAAEEAQRRLAEELGSERRLLRAIIDYLPTGLTVTEAASGRLLLRNAEAERLLGRPPEPGDEVRSSYSDLGAVHADGTPYRAGDYPTVRALQHGEVVQGEEMLYRRGGGGRPFVLSVNSAPVRDEGGGFGLVVTTFHDITERKAMEEALRASEARLSWSERHLTRAQAVARTGSWELDLASGTLEWSAEVHRITGRPDDFRPDLEGALALLEEEARAPVRAALARAAAGEVPDGLDLRIVRPDGEVRFCRLECGPVTSAGSGAGSGSGEGVVGVVGTFQDVTELRLAETRRLELERHLQQTQKIEALGTLAGGIAHDLNNMLVPVLGMAELVMEELPEGSAHRDDLRLIQEGAARARDLVRRILAFGRREAPEPLPVDLAEVVARARDFLCRLLPATVELRCRLEPGAVVLADASQLHQVIVNLVTNAAQAIGDEPGAITVSVRGEGETVRLGVSDTGRGMDDAIRARIFEPFFTTKPVGQGSGLGLSVVHGIVAGWGGRIEVRSGPGSGTAFDVHLPRLDAGASCPLTYPKESVT